MSSNRRGKAKLPEYGPWADMLQRCRNSHLNNYHRYGARGISVCAAWQDFDTFYRDMGPRPAGTSLGRINNDGDYCPENCRWEIAEQQNFNKCSNRILTHNECAMPVTKWAKQVGLSRVTLLSRLNRGWSIEDALTTPVFQKGGHR